MRPSDAALRGFWLVVAGILVAGLSLRGPIVAVSPVLRDIERDLGLSAATAGLLTTAPVLMFAVLTPLAALVIRRAGAELALLLSLSGVLVGTVVRTLPGFGSLMAGMVVIGASITIGNVVIPVIIRRDVPGPRVVIVTAAYTATLNAGSLVTSLLTAPLAAAVGWNAALAMWSAITIAGVVLWAIHMRRSGTEDRFSGEPARPNPHAGAVRPDLEQEALTGPLPVVAPARRGAGVLRRPVTWLLLGSFAGQTTIYYSLTTWLPTFAAEELGLAPAAAGAIASVYQGVGIVGAFVVPVLARSAPRLVAPLVICASWLVVGGGLLLAPELLWVWLAFGAIGHGGGFVVIFSALVGVARSGTEAARMSALVQGGGYAVGALGGPVTGALFESTGGWTAPLVGVFALSVVYCVLLMGAVLASVRTTR